MTLTPSKQFPYHHAYVGPFNQTLNEVFKQVPGCFWGPINGGPRNWMLPNNALGVLEEGAWEYAKVKVGNPKNVVTGRRSNTLPLCDSMGLREYQHESVRRTLTGPLLCAQEMRMGKTASAITAMQIKGAKTALIVCPAIARGVWLSEFEKWWPGHPQVGAIVPGEDLPNTPLVICSYEGMKHIDSTRPFDALIFDESVHLKDSRSGRSERAMAHRLANPKALCMMLSGMPIALNPIDLWNQLAILEPFAWGTYKQFAKRYCIVEANNYSEVAKVYGVNEAFLPELQERLKHTVHRVVKADYPGLFPPLTCDLIVIPTKKKNRRVGDWLSGGKLALGKIDKWLNESADLRVKAAVEWAEQTEKAVVFVWLKTTAKKIADELGDRAILITGDETPERRMKRLSVWRPGQVIVATIASCKTAIDLSFCHQVLFAEPYWSPEAVGQAMMRLHHMDGEPVSVYILQLQKTIDEAICSVLVERIQSEESTIGNSEATSKLSGALVGKEESTEDWAARIGKLALEKEGED